MKLERLSADGGWELAGCYYFGEAYRGPSVDGDYFAFSQLLEKQREQPLESCQNVELTVYP
jgi:hypothetical protein